MQNFAGVFIAVAAVLILVSTPAAAGVPEAGKFGLGVSVGTPSSFTGKYFLTDHQALDFHIGTYPFIAAGYTGSFMLAGDYLLEVFEVVDESLFRMSLYGGAGIMAIFNTADARVYDPDFGRPRRIFDYGMGLRVPMGLSTQFKEAPIEVFFELSPSFVLLFVEERRQTHTSVRVPLFNAALGGRYYFN